MKWETHKRITGAVCKALNLSGKVVDASTLPDQHNEFAELPNGKHVRIAHHSRMALRAAWRHLKNARKLLLTGRDYSYELGMALHYIQDYVVDPTRGIFVFKWRSDAAHDRREKELAKQPVSELAITEGIKIRDPNTLKELIFSIKRERDPERIMYTAAMVSSAAASVVANPERRGFSWFRALLLHTLFIAAPFVIVAGSPLYLPISATMAYLAHRLDVHYHRARLEKEWFG